MNRLSTLSLIAFVLLSTQAKAITSQYPCDKVIYQNTLTRSDRTLRVCLSDKDISLTLTPNGERYEGIDIRLPVSRVFYHQTGIANRFELEVRPGTYYSITYSAKHVRLLNLVEDNLSRSYRLESPTIDDFSPMLHHYGISVKQ